MDDQTSYLDVTPKYFVIAFVWAFFKPQFAIDGGPPQQARWGQNMVPVAPGQHQVSVWCPYLWMPQCGLNTAVVEAQPGSVTKVTWNAPWIVFMQGSISVGGGALPSGAEAYGALPQSQAVAGTPADWYPDPQGRHEKRYWDGSAWTAHVSDGGMTSEDPV